MSFLETMRILATQYGFRIHKSTDDAVYDITDFLVIAKKLDIGKKYIIYLLTSQKSSILLLFQNPLNERDNIRIKIN